MTHQKTLAALCLAACLNSPAIAAAATLHIELWGQNNPHCGSEANPCRTLAYTMSRRARPTDTILLGPGDYRENMVVEQLPASHGRGGIRIESKLGRGATSIHCLGRSLPGLRLSLPQVAAPRSGRGITVYRSNQATVADFAIGSVAS